MGNTDLLGTILTPKEYLFTTVMMKESKIMVFLFVLILYYLGKQSMYILYLKSLKCLQEFETFLKRKAL